MSWPKVLDKLADDFASLPGVGPKLARKIAVHLVAQKAELAEVLAHDLRQSTEEINECPTCGNLKEREAKGCNICESSRDRDRLLVIESVLDLMSMEQNVEFDGYYFVLGGLLSPVKGFAVRDLRLDKLQEVLEERGTKELILGLANTLEGEATAIYLKNFFSKEIPDLEITQLAVGIPTGVNLEFLDQKTLKGALAARA